MSAVPAAWRLGHVVLASGTTAVAAVAGALAAPIGLGWQLALAGAAVALLGLPHGAVDHVFARRALEPRLGRIWPVPFAAAYLALAGAVVALWLAAPAVALAGFLALSVWHFGEEDAALAPILPDGGAAPEAVARGLLPILLPVAFRPEETGLLFAWLLFGPSAEAVGGALAAARAATLPAALALVAGLGLAAAARRRWPALAETGLLAAAFAALPPLPAFAVYFCIWHAPRHTLRVVADLHPGRLADGLAAFARDALALTLAALALAAAAWWAAGGPSALGETAVRVLFIGLAALTVPHAALHALRPSSAVPEASRRRRGESGEPLAR
jgi:Brp/Blh family beta-carotene 15,15'-monooxygenase